MNCLQACARATPQGKFNSRHAPTFIGYLKGTHFECKKIARVFQCKFFVNFFLSACELSTCHSTLTPETISSYASTSASPQAHLAFKFAFPPLADPICEFSLLFFSFERLHVICGQLTPHWQQTGLKTSYVRSLLAKKHKFIISS